MKNGLYSIHVNLLDGRVVNRIQVNDRVKHWARMALDRMLEVGR